MKRTLVHILSKLEAARGSKGGSKGTPIHEGECSHQKLANQNAKEKKEIARPALNAGWMSRRKWVDREDWEKYGGSLVSAATYDLAVLG
jgi:hypothetical protein